jgi:hypothetical protein
MFLLTTTVLDIYAFRLLFLHIYSFCSLVLSFLFIHNFSSQTLDKNVAALDFVACQNVAALDFGACQNVLEEGEHP